MIVNPIAKHCGLRVKIVIPILKHYVLIEMIVIAIKHIKNCLHEKLFTSSYSKKIIIYNIQSLSHRTNYKIRRITKL